MEDGSWAMYASILALLLISAYFSASETAFSSVNKIRLKNQVESDENKKAKNALKISEEFDKTLSTILVGNNVVNIAMASIGTILFTRLFGAPGAAISTLVITLLVLVFGEILPKSYARENSEKVALSFSGSLKFVMFVFTPITKLFNLLQRAFSKLYQSDEVTYSVTEEELKYILETIEDEGVLEEVEADLVQSALDFSDTTVQEILTPRVDLVAIDVEDDLTAIMEVVMEERFTRMPVYEKSVDHIIGILYTRDLLEALVRNEKVDLRDIISDDVMFVHKTKKLGVLLSDFQRERVHIAVVTDDYGGTMGIVTMEDLLEELVGEIWDEDDEIEEYFVPLDDDTFEVSGDMSLEDLFDELDFEDRHFDSDYHTLSGWALEEFERLPEVGDSFTYKGITATVSELEEQRIKKFIVQYVPEVTEDEEDTD